MLAGNKTPYESHVVWAPSANRQSGGQVFHYTSPAGLHGILSTGKMWFTNAAFLNDRNEVLYSSQLALQALAEAKSQAPQPEIAKLLEDTHARLQVTSLYDHLYFVSFSKAENRLSQWRAYCPEGGYAIGFDSAVLGRSPDIFDCRDVIYEIEAQQQILRGVIANFLKRREEVHSHFFGEVDPIRLEEDGIQSLIFALGMAGCFLKQSVFSEECEWRMIRFRGFKPEDGLSLSFRTHRNKLVPYTEIDLRKGGLLPLTGLCASPFGDQVRAKHSGNLCLRHHKYTGFECAAAGYVLG